MGGARNCLVDMWGRGVDYERTRIAEAIKARYLRSEYLQGRNLWLRPNNPDERRYVILYNIYQIREGCLVGLREALRIVEEE